MKKLILVPVFCLISFSSYAQDFGRLPDGRAYRTDREGNQVVDYIAELEATVDALTKQVIAFEDAGAGKAPVCEPKECAPQVIREVVSTPAECPKVVKDCTEEVEKAKAVKENEANQRVALLSNQLESLKETLSDNQDQKNIDEAKASLSLELLQKEEQHKNDQKVITELRAALDEEKSKLSSLLDASRQDKTELAALREKARETTSRVAFEQPVVVSAQSEQMRAPQLEPSEGFKSLKSTVLAETNRVLSLQGTRDALFSSGKNQSGALSISPNAARSNDGRSLKALKDDTIDATSLRELLQIRKSLTEIRKILESDIEAIKRVQRVR